MCRNIGVVLAAVCAAVGACAGASAEIALPSPDDWSEPREAPGLALGPDGAWDDHPPGAITPCAVVKLKGVYHLYYIGSDAKRDHDDGPAHRALGLATSQDGRSFVKHEANPIMTWSPAGNDEEGIFGVSATVVGGVVHLFINTVSAVNATTPSVQADVHYATSTDGVEFTEPQLALSHADASVVGHGDEVGPTGVMEKDGAWALYYFAKGIGFPSWGLCLATGRRPLELGDTQGLIAERDFFGTGGNVQWLSKDKAALFFQKRSDWSRIEVYTASADAPGKLTQAAAWEGLVKEEGMTVFLDREAGKWFLYDRRGGVTFVRTAPVELR